MRAPRRDDRPRRDGGPARDDRSGRAAPTSRPAAGARPTRSSSRTGRSTSTSTTRAGAAPRSTRSGSSTASRSSTSRTINTTRSTSGRSRPPLAQGQSIDRDLIVVTDSDGRRGMIASGCLETIDKERDPQRRQPPRRRSRALASTRTASTACPGRRGITGIGYNPNKVGGEITSIDQLLTDPKLKGKVTLLTEMPDTVGLVMARERRRPGERHAGGLRERRRAHPGRRRLGPDPSVHRQRVRAAACPRRRVGGDGVVGRRHPAPARQPGSLWSHPRQRIPSLDATTC